jgi:hypothetical protein
VPERKAVKFQEKAAFADKNENRLTVSNRQVGDVEFKVSVAHHPKDGKRKTGMIDVFESKDAAHVRFVEVTEKCVSMGWTKTSAATREAFTELPAPNNE